jgi:ATP-dependent Clp protease ATP-binding subunit ClpA
MFQRMRQRIADMKTMKLLFTTAEDAARAAGAARPGAEHLLLATLELPDGSARRAFQRVGADPDAFQAALAAQHAQALHGIGVVADDSKLDAYLPEPGPATGVYQTEVSAQQLFQQVVGEVKARRSHLTGAHIVLAAANSRHGTTIRTLRHMGIELDELARAAEAELAPPR